jgi:hypothetical protein
MNTKYYRYSYFADVYHINTKPDKLQTQGMNLQILINECFGAAHFTKRADFE